MAASRSHRRTRLPYSLESKEQITACILRYICIGMMWKRFINKEIDRMLVISNELAGDYYVELILS